MELSSDIKRQGFAWKKLKLSINREMDKDVVHPFSGILVI